MANSASPHNSLQRVYRAEERERGYDVKTLGMTLIDVYSADRHERKKITRQRQREIRNEEREG